MGLRNSRGFLQKFRAGGIRFILSRKSAKGMSGSLKKEAGSEVKGARELLNLSCSVNYDSKRTTSKPCLSSRNQGKATIPL
jgi:hypothetical protein